jgi:endoglucanase
LTDSDVPQALSSSFLQVALDYNAPMLTLAAMHVLNDSNDPFYTTLQAGAYDQVKPQGEPCDAVFKKSCRGGLPRGGQIALGVSLGVVGLVLLGLLVYYMFLVSRIKTA